MAGENEAISPQGVAKRRMVPRFPRLEALSNSTRQGLSERGSAERSSGRMRTTAMSSEVSVLPLSSSISPAVSW